jgi:hypothetical protein
VTAASGGPEPLAEEEFVLAKLDFFQDVQLWPTDPVRGLHPREWLSNFEDPTERTLAVHLLDRFLFFADPLTDELLRGAVNDLAREIVPPHADVPAAQLAWSDFLNGLLITYPTGEDPSPTDSGYLFARKARDVLGFLQERIRSPEEAVAQVTSARTSRILMLDDFLGSGNQFIETWKRDRGGGSLEMTANGGFATVYYVPVLASSSGLARVASEAPKAIVRPAHVLGPEYSALSDQSAIWPKGCLDRGRDFVEASSRRAGLPDHGKNTWTGFAKLGLCVGFGHGIPDATLPIFYWTENNWKPLVHRP